MRGNRFAAYSKSCLHVSSVSKGTHAAWFTSFGGTPGYFVIKLKSKGEKLKSEITVEKGHQELLSIYIIIAVACLQQ